MVVVYSALLLDLTLVVVSGVVWNFQGVRRDLREILNSCQLVYVKLERFYRTLQISMLSLVRLHWFHTCLAV